MALRRLLRLDPEGKLERIVAVPVRYPTIPAFEGSDLETNYVTSANWTLQPEDARNPLEGSLFAQPAPVPGHPARVTRL